MLDHSARAASSLSACGTERWAVKTLADPAARTINFHPRRVSISYLRRLTPTHTYTRGPGVERTTYKIKARLVETTIEDDEDIHLVVADPRHRSRTMIVEFPSPNCTHHSIHRKQMKRARAAFEHACGVPPSGSFRYLHGRATITGVGFFDYNHGQTGIAPNAIELHPVLSFAHAQCR
jgi:predicted RNA-binding Zn-ribbon protein involved in translation (DUF1610 family)